MIVTSNHINWADIESVFLDMDGTLLDLHFDDHFWQDFLPRRYAENHGLTLDAAKDTLNPRFEAKQGTLEWYCLDYWSRELGLDIPALKQELSHLIAIHDGVLDFLTAAREAGKRLVLVTNAHGKALDLKMQHTDLAGHFDALICSHDLGLPKEDPAFWERLQKVEPYAPQHTLFIDDSLSVLQAARSYGINYLLNIAKPSSQKPARQDTEFPLLHHFRDLIPH